VTAPRVSVLLAVRDGAAHVGEAVGSVLHQTLADLELIVIDDGSRDATPAVLAGVSDPRLRVVRQAPAGLTRSLNSALALARAPLIARLDADDFSRPERLARQTAFLAEREAVGVLGTAALEIDEAGLPVRTVVPPATDADVRRTLIRRNPLVHSSVMVRRRLLEEVGGYDERIPVAQDYDLWLRLVPRTRFANLVEPLVVRRLLPGRVSLAREPERLRAELRARWRAIRSGAYPWWTAVWVARTAMALAMPRGLRELVRQARD
jgi:glycosyltransferase involved in cell wall biosynthesis